MDPRGCPSGIGAWLVERLNRDGLGILGTRKAFIEFLERRHTIGIECPKVIIGRFDLSILANFGRFHPTIPPLGAHALV